MQPISTTCSTALRKMSKMRPSSVHKCAIHTLNVPTNTMSLIVNISCVVTGPIFLFICSVTEWRTARIPVTKQWAVILLAQNLFAKTALSCPDMQHVMVFMIASVSKNHISQYNFRGKYSCRKGLMNTFGS